MRCFLLSVCIVMYATAACAEEGPVRYRCCAEDSAMVCRLLGEDVGDNGVLYFARRLIGVPYVGQTLEGNEPECLVVNVHGLDCTTLVESVLALARTCAEGGRRLEDYMVNLADLRYRDGRLDGYLSRLHYFDWWINDNVRRGNVEVVCDSSLFTAEFRVDNHYMSQHPDAYRHLRGRTERIDSIRALEAGGNGGGFCFLPKERTRLGRRELGFIRDGDVIAIVTGKDGLDYAHLGFAVWGRDGCLHLLNASSVRKRVVEEPRSLYEYLAEHPSFLGIRVLRMKD